MRCDILFKKTNFGSSKQFLVQQAELSPRLSASADYNVLKSYDRHLTPDYCKKNIGLNIIPIEKCPDLREVVIFVHHACMLSFDGSNVYKIIQNHERGTFIKIST